jgi:hypothetical protein
VHKELVAADSGEAPFKRPKKWSALERLCPESGSKDWLTAGRDVVEKNPLPKIKKRDMDSATKHLARMVICS